MKCVFFSNIPMTINVAQQVFKIIIKPFIVQIVNTQIRFMAGIVFLALTGYCIRSVGDVLEPIATLRPVLERDGKKGCVQLGDWFNFQEYTISFSVWPTESQVPWAAIIDNNHRGDRSFAFHQLQDKKNTYSFGIHSKEEPVGIVVVLYPNRWTHLVLQNTGLAIKMYINGHLYKSVAYSAARRTQYTGEEQLCIGGWFPGGRLWKGKIKDIKFYNKAIFPSDLSKLR